MPLIPTPKQTYGYIRLLYAYPQSHCLSISIDDKIVKKKWYYEDFTKYLKIACGYHTLSIKNIETDELLLEKKLSIKPNAFFTYLYTAHPKQPELPYLSCVEDLPKAFTAPQAFVRLCHLGTSQPQVDFQLKDDRLLYKHLNYLQASRYISVECSQHIFHISLSHSPETLLTEFKKPLKFGRLYTLYLIGNGSNLFPYHLIISIDGPSFIQIKKDVS